MTDIAIGTLLVANRGEIARRIIRTARRLGVATVAVYSDADAQAPHVADADRALRLGPAPPAESYLSIERVLAAARAGGADAVHPGYGFLAENAAFAEACADAGLVFVGPDSHAIGLMGNKRLAKEHMEQAGIACVPGWHGVAQDARTLREAARALGFPLLIKAASGGGGRGMRVVAEAGALDEALESARSEAEAGFGDGALILERLLADARHIEVQIFADRHGNVVHLGARDCSVQRRHQKVIEEAPPPGLAPELAEGLCATAVRAARAISYLGAGTVELLVAGNGYYFLEMNTRLQVEHPVTEMVTGLDLVEWQLRVAAGEPLLAQDAVGFSGHAIEARLYAEDPAAGFLPQAGRVLAWRPGAGEGVRIDDGIAEGTDIPPHYDPLLAKVIAYGEDREQARARLTAALRATVLLGVRTNKRFLLDLVRDEAFARGAVTTAFAEGRARDRDDRPSREEIARAAALAFAASLPARPDSWRSAGCARWPMLLAEGGRRHAVAVAMAGEDIRVEAGGVAPAAALAHLRDGAALWLDCGDGARAWEDVTYAPARPPAAAVSGRVCAPIAGRVVRLAAAPGAAVAAGATLVVIESMKIEHAVTAPAGGTVERVAVRAGDQVAARALLVDIACERGDG